MDLKSPNLVEEATVAKLYKPDDGEFNFAKVFSEYYMDPALARSGRFGGGRRLLKEYSKDGNFVPHCEKNLSSLFPTRSDTNRHKPGCTTQKIARSLIFRI